MPFFFLGKSLRAGWMKVRHDSFGWLAERRLTHQAGHGCASLQNKPLTMHHG
jgi:hypothetical protein